MKNDSLSLLIKEFVAIGAAAALGAEHGLSTHLKWPGIRGNQRSSSFC